MLTNFLKVLFRRLRLIKIDRNFLVFLIFLAISIVFWFMQTIQETTEVTIAYKLKIDELPKDVVYTSNVPDEVQVSFSSKGWNAFDYKFMKNDTHELSIPFKEVNQKSGKIVIDANAMKRAISRTKLQGMSFKSTSPSKIEAFYSNGQHKRVPIVFNGRVTTTAGRYECGIILHPDSVDIYAPKHLYGSINSIKTENFTFNDLQDTLHTRLALLVPQGAKALPDSIEAEICVDIFTDKTLQVPIYSENVPNSKIIRTFPLKVEVTFLVSATLYDNITADDFLLVVDYNDTKPGTNRCKLYIRQRPENIRHLRINPEFVEYVIEQVGQ